MTGVRVGAKSNQAWPQRSPPLVRDGRLTSHRFESCHGNDLIALGLATTRRRLNWVQARVSAIISLPSTYSASKGCDDQLSDPIRGRR
jgi:hypothetical protein